MSDSSPQKISKLHKQRYHAPASLAVRRGSLNVPENVRLKTAAPVFRQPKIVNLGGERVMIGETEEWLLRLYQ